MTDDDMVNRAPGSEVRGSLKHLNVSVHNIVYMFYKPNSE